MGPHEPIGGGYTAGKPEGDAPDRPTLPYRGLADAEVIASAREIYRKLQETPRWSAENAWLIRAWSEVCAEMNLRRLTDDVTSSPQP
jgi:hypothetical protein